MRSMLIGAVVVGLSLAGVVGCQSGGGSESRSSTTQRSRSGDAKTSGATADACPMCPGVQTAKADGTCPKCGMKVKG